MDEASLAHWGPFFGFTSRKRSQPCLAESPGSPRQGPKPGPWRGLEAAQCPLGEGTGALGAAERTCRVTGSGRKVDTAGTQGPGPVPTLLAGGGRGRSPAPVKGRRRSSALWSASPPFRWDGESNFSRSLEARSHPPTSGEGGRVSGQRRPRPRAPGRTAPEQERGPPSCATRTCRSGQSRRVPAMARGP